MCSATDVEILSRALAGTSESALAEHSMQHADLGKRIASASARWQVQAKAPSGRPKCLQARLAAGIEHVPSFVNWFSFLSMWHRPLSCLCNY